eukprot:jgi/Undpi1/2639/HiC_scaffold_13.g06018.m1
MMMSKKRRRRRFCGGKPEKQKKTKRTKEGRCCRGINCVSLFCSSGDDDEDGALLYNATLLRKEQARFGELVREADRKNFVIEHVPLAKLSKGSMMAANSPVCNLAFRKLFGVSETLISACKRTPGARASSSSDRRTTISATRGHPKLDRVVSFLGRHQEEFAQKMPNSDDSYLYLHNKNTCTLLKEKLHGQAGSRGTQNQAERERCTREYEAHVKEVEQDRQYCARVERDAQEARSRGEPWELVYLQVDAANQSSFATPLAAYNAHGVDDRGYAERQKIYGVFVAGVIMNIFMTPQILGTGSNLVCTALFIQFTELWHKFQNNRMGDVVIQMDNTVSENKNNYIMGFLAAMIARGVMRSVTLCFMMVGHTHIQIDQIFSCFARAVKGCNVFSREHLAEFFARAYLTLPVQSRTLENLANFKDLVKPVTRRIHDITKFHAFRIHKEGSAVLVEVKEKVHHPNWLGFSADGKTVGTGEGFKGWRLMRVGSVRLEGAPPYLLKVVDPTIIRQIELRQQASWQRLPAAFPGDEARQAQIKDEHADSLRILRSTGDRTFDLDTNWLPVDPNLIGGDDSDDESSDDDGGGAGGEGYTSNNASDDNSSDEDDFSRDERTLQQGASGGTKQRQQRATKNVEHGALSSFAFFTPTNAPFLVGKVNETRIGTDGQREILLHWYTPKKALIDNAVNAEFDVYANATFNAAYEVGTAPVGAGRSGSRQRYVADTSWEPVCGIVATCSALIGGGKKIPAPVRQTLKVADQRQQHLPEEEDEEQEGEESNYGKGEQRDRQEIEGGAEEVQEKEGGHDVQERGREVGKRVGHRGGGGYERTEPPQVGSRAPSRRHRPKKLWPELS